MTLKRLGPEAGFPAPEPGDSISAWRASITEQNSDFSRNFNDFALERIIERRLNVSPSLARVILEAGPFGRRAGQ